MGVDRPDRTYGELGFLVHPYKWSYGSLFMRNLATPQEIAGLIERNMKRNHYDPPNKALGVVALGGHGDNIPLKHPWDWDC